MTHYKGLIIDNNLIEDYKYSEYLGYLPDYHMPFEYNIGFYSNLEFSDTDKNKLKKLICDNIKFNKDIKWKRNSISFNIEDKELINSLDMLLDNLNKEQISPINKISSNIGTTLPIVYELVKDYDGNLFGRELYTKELFPIFNSKTKKNKYLVEIKYDYDSILVTQVKCFIESIPIMKVSSMIKCENFIVGHQVANLNDYDRYINKFRGTRLFKRDDEKALKEWKDKIIKYSHTNVFKEDFYLEEDNKKDEIIKDVVLQKISETNKKIDKSLLDNNRKEELKNSLIELAHYYVETIKNMNNNKSVNLNVNETSIISLRQEIMKKLVEIEMQLPPEDINILTNELNLLEKEIRR